VKGSAPWCADPIFVRIFRPLWSDLEEIEAVVGVCAQQGIERNPISVVSIFLDCPAVVQIPGKRLAFFLLERFHLTLCTHGDGADLVPHLVSEDGVDLCKHFPEVVMLHIFLNFWLFSLREVMEGGSASERAST